MLAVPWQEWLLEAAKGAFVGGLIGYATNQLAVWMLFHPREALRVGGVDLPLTPGLVVKNQERLAEAIGRAVARDLLDAETIGRHIGEIELEAPLRTLVSEERMRLAEEEQPLAALLAPEHREGLERLRDTLAADLTARLIRLAARLEDAQSRGRAALRDVVAGVVATRVSAILDERRQTAVVAWTRHRLLEYVHSGEARMLVREGVAMALRDLPRREGFAFLEDVVRDALRPHLGGLTQGVQDRLAEFLTSAEFARLARDRIAGRLHELVVSKFPMAAMLVSEELLADLIEDRWSDIAGELEAMARREEVGRVIAREVEQGVGTLVGRLEQAMDHPETSGRTAVWLTSEIEAGLGRWLESEASSLALSGILDRVRDRTVGDLFGGDEQLVYTLAETLAIRLARWLEGDEGRALVGDRVRAAIDSALFRQPLGRVFAFVPEKEWDTVGGVAATMIADRVRRFLPRLMQEHVDLEGIVREKVRAFDAPRIEETIRRVSGRELTGIVRLGGLIGIVVGALTQLLYLFLERAG